MQSAYFYSVCAYAKTARQGSCKARTLQEKGYTLVALIYIKSKLQFSLALKYKKDNLKELIVSSRSLS